jgi:aminoglycoside phosphotransferase (APT) family kinase protein
MDPMESIVETCRFRESEVLRALKGHVPVAPMRFADGAGEHLGQPGIVTGFVRGVSKPPTNDAVLSGVGTSFNKQWRDRLTPQYVENLAKIHAFDWRRADLPHFSAPTASPTQAALWQVNWWSKVWRDDFVHPYPLFTLTERWMRERLPVCEEPVLLHGDYRTSNFMFDAETGEFTAVLDWELAHIGDFHEDLGWIVQKLFAGPPVDGVTHICGLMPREEFLERYETATGRKINRKTLAFYEAFAAYKLAAMNIGTSVGLAHRQNNHQDVVLTFLVPTGHTFSHQLVDAIREEAAL